MPRSERESIEARQQCFRNKHGSACHVCQLQRSIIAAMDASQRLAGSLTGRNSAGCPCDPKRQSFLQLPLRVWNREQTVRVQAIFQLALSSQKNSFGSWRGSYRKHIVTVSQTLLQHLLTRGAANQLRQTLELSHYTSCICRSLQLQISHASGVYSMSMDIYMNVKVDSSH